MRHATVALFALLALTTVSAAQDGRCAAEQNLRSANSNTPASMTFINAGSGSLGVYWINFDGQREHYADIAPGDFWTTQTFVTHPWVIEHESGGCMGIYFPEMRHRDIRLR